MTISGQLGIRSYNEAARFKSAVSQKRRTWPAAQFAAVRSALKQPLMRPTTIAALVDQETTAHCLKRAQAVLSPEEFESHAQRIALLRSATDADIGRDSRKTWAAGVRRCCRAGVEGWKNRIRRVSRQRAVN